MIRNRQDNKYNENDLKELEVSRQEDGQRFDEDTNREDLYQPLDSTEAAILEEDLRYFGCGQDYDLHQIHTVPAYLKHNEYIIKGYRADLGFVKSLKSIFHWHNGKHNVNLNFHTLYSFPIRDCKHLDSFGWILCLFDPIYHNINNNTS